MHLTAETVRHWEQRYGQPGVLDTDFLISPYERDIVEGSLVRGRAHDVTLFIFDGPRMALIHKPLLPVGAFRAPSGGLLPWETLEIGAAREALEETGLEIALDRYLLRVLARFCCEDWSAKWTSHVFKAHRLSGELGPIDTDEILEARYCDLAELQGSIRDKLQQSTLGLLRYRVVLTDAALALLEPEARHR